MSLVFLAGITIFGVLAVAAGCSIWHANRRLSQACGELEAFKWHASVASKAVTEVPPKR